MNARDGFAQLLRAEWTKFRSVRGTRWSAIAVVVLTIGLSIFGASAFRTVSGCPCQFDEGHFVHQPQSGDGSVTARVASQQDTGHGPRAGVMMRSSLEPLSPYASIAVVPGQGVRMQSNYGEYIAGSTRTAPLWLRLTRTAGTITGAESTDGINWTTVGRVDASQWPAAAASGLFVTSPGTMKTVRITGGAQGGYVYTPSTATFDRVSLVGSDGEVTGSWTSEDRTGPLQDIDGNMVAGHADIPEPGAGATGVFRVTGAGDARTDPPAGNDDVVRNSLAGVLFGLIAATVLGVTYITAEYSRGTIRTTFAASPRRGRVLAAKAVIVTGVTFAGGLLASVVAFVATQPLVHRNGYRPPAYPYASLTDSSTLRAVAGTAAVLTFVALLGLALGTVLRRAPGAIALIIAPVLVPVIVAPLLPLSPGIWLQRITPSAGLAIQQTRDRFDSPIEPWAGLGVLVAYVVAVMAVALWSLRRRDV